MDGTPSYTLWMMQPGHQWIHGGPLGSDVRPHLYNPPNVTLTGKDWKRWIFKKSPGT
jgi:hypothetical protein